MSNITFHDQSITLAQREEKNGHKSAVLWFTRGLQTYRPSTFDKKNYLLPHVT